jgi:hypothetical protein
MHTTIGDSCLRPWSQLPTMAPVSSPNTPPSSPGLLREEALAAALTAATAVPAAVGARTVPRLGDWGEREASVVATLMRSCPSSLLGCIEGLSAICPGHTNEAALHQGGMAPCKTKARG